MRGVAYLRGHPTEQVTTVSEKRLVDPVELAKASHMRPGDPRIAMLVEVSGLRKLERVYNEVQDLKGEAFVAALLERLEVGLEVSESDLARIPREGGVIFVANHPYGAVDGLSLLHALGPVRPDLKVMANFLLQQLAPLEGRFIGVNPFEQLKTLSSFHGMRASLEHVHAGGALGIFPAGEVSSYRTDLRSVADPIWKAPVIKLVRMAKVPVVPVWFDGSNGFLFHMLGMIHPDLRTLALPQQMLRMKGRKVLMRIGKPISGKEIAGFNDTERLGRYLRAKTYALGSGIEVRREQFRPLLFPKRPQEIVPPVPKDVLAEEVRGLDDLRMSSQSGFDLFLAPSDRIPNMLREIGRLREETFRAVGEGTNKSIDLDEFDLYYDHLFLWNKEDQALAGAYRIGDGARIMRRYGKRGFYTHTLFRMDRGMIRVLARSYELGRSFVPTAYQKHRLPLYLLWRGLLLHLLSNPEHRYLIGPVSISGSYSRLSRSLIMDFVEQHYYDKELAAMIRPRKKFKVRIKRTDSKALLDSTADLKDLDKLIADVEPKGFTVPVLLKKYLLLNARIVGFNRDPHFNDALDGLMVLDLTKVPEKTIEDLQRGMAAPPEA